MRHRIQQLGNIITQWLTKERDIDESIEQLYGQGSIELATTLYNSLCIDKERVLKIICPHRDEVVFDGETMCQWMPDCDRLEECQRILKEMSIGNIVKIQEEK